MSTPCTVVLSQYADLCWYVASGTGHGDWQDLAEALTAMGERKIDVILLPDWYSVHQVSFIDAERRMLAKTVPFSLEDELADDIDACHFALAEPFEGNVEVAVVKRENVAGILGKAAEHGLSVNSMKTCRAISGNLWLQLSESTAALIGKDHSVVVEQRQVTAIKNAADAAQNPVIALHPGIHLWPEWTNFSNDALLAHVVGGIDVLQGEFRKGIAWSGVWRMWRAPALAASILMAALVGQAWWQVELLEARNLDVRQAIENTYREAFPSGRVVNPRRQMEAKLADIQGIGQSGGSNMLALLSTLGAEPQASSLQVSAMNYEARAAELRIDIVAENFQQVEKLRSALRARGISAELQNSSASGNKVRAKLALKEIG